ncbi:MAG: AzlC family ABC transporter permease [Chloroflexota bacterium]
MKPIHKDFLAGAKAALPILLGVIPFSIITGVSAVAVGLSPLDSFGMSVIVFAGASQLAVLQLLKIGSPWIIMVLTAWIINLRFIMYSAVLAPSMQNLKTRQKALLAYMLSDQAFGISMSYFATHTEVNRRWFFFGTALTIWTTWQISAIAGSLLGTLIPPAWGFDFAFPLSFMALMFAALTDRPTVVAALAGGLTAVAGKGLPYNIGLMLAAVVGISSGLLVENILKKSRSGSRQ